MCRSDKLGLAGQGRAGHGVEMKGGGCDRGTQRRSRRGIHLPLE